jgi:hypothetical protein
MCPGVLRKTGVSGIEAWRRKGKLRRPGALVGFHDGQGGARRKTRDPKARMRKYYRVRNELQMLNELSRLAAINDGDKAHVTGFGLYTTSAH